MTRTLLTFCCLWIANSAYSHDLQLRLDSETFYVGAPVSVHLRFELDDTAPPDLRHITINNRSIEIWLRDSSGESTSKMALRAQGSILRGVISHVTYCHVFSLLKSYIGRDDPEIARAMVHLIEDMKSGKTSWDPFAVEGYLEMYVWAVHETHTRGDAEVMAITDAFVHDYPKPDAPEEDVPLSSLNYN